MPPRMHCIRRLIVHTLVFSRSYLHRQASPPETLVVKGRTTWARNGPRILPQNARLPCNIQESFTCRKSTTWDKRLYFPSEGRRAEDFFFALKTPTGSAGFEPANFGTKGQHATSRPPLKGSLRKIHTVCDSDRAWRFLLSAADTMTASTTSVCILASPPAATKYFLTYTTQDWTYLFFTFSYFNYIKT